MHIIRLRASASKLFKLVSTQLLCVDFSHIKALLDNEFQQAPDGHAQYFVDLEEAYRASSIVVPLTYNDPGEGRNFINGTVRRSNSL